ncbi:hypothetical protein [Bifidobacterium sp.]|uniref:hypothetical protein n=1 Tax=Bifidobacterium sp. TaxID=41200 RepID=UPI003D7EFA87
MAEEEKTQDVSEKGDKKRIATISVIAVVVVLAGIGGGYAYASNRAYDSYESRVESAKKADSKLMGKIAEAQKLVNATKDTDVLDKTTLASLNESIKTSEAQKGVPDSGNAAKWNLWSVSKAKTIVANDMAEANDSINAINKAMGKVKASKTAKQVKDAKDTLDRTVKSAESLYKDSEGKVQDDKTRGGLKTAIDNAKKASSDKKADMKSLTTASDALSKAIKAVNDSKNAKTQVDIQKQTQEQVQAQGQSTGTSSGSYSSSGYSNADGSYSAGSGAYSNGGHSSYSGNSGQSSQGSQPQNSNNCTQYGCNGYDYRKDFDSAGGGFKPASSDNYLGTDGENDYYEFGGDSHGNMW